MIMTTLPKFPLLIAVENQEELSDLLHLVQAGKCRFSEHAEKTQSKIVKSWLQEKEYAATQFQIRIEQTINQGN